MLPCQEDIRQNRYSGRYHRFLLYKQHIPEEITGHIYWKGGYRECKSLLYLQLPPTVSPDQFLVPKLNNLIFHLVVQMNFLKGNNTGSIRGQQFHWIMVRGKIITVYWGFIQVWWGKCHSPLTASSKSWWSILEKIFGFRDKINHGMILKMVSFSVPDNFTWIELNLT